MMYLANGFFIATLILMIAVFADDMIKSLKSSKVVEDQLEKLKKFSDYGENWDTYQSKPVNKVSCDRCRLFLIHLNNADRKAKSINVYPTANGDIGVEYKIHNTKYCIFFEKEGSFLEIDDLEIGYLHDLKLLERLGI